MKPKQLTLSLGIYTYSSVSLHFKVGYCAYWFMWVVLWYFIAPSWAIHWWFFATSAIDFTWNGFFGHYCLHFLCLCLLRLILNLTIDSGSDSNYLFCRACLASIAKFCWYHLVFCFLPHKGVVCCLVDLSTNLSLWSSFYKSCPCSTF